MKKRLIALACLVAVAAMFVSAQTADEGFQTATVVSIDKVPEDARHPENSGRYKISMRLADTIYVCHANGSASVFIDWSANKQFPARVNGKVLEVKNHDGQLVELNITGKKTPK